MTDATLFPPCEPSLPAAARIEVSGPRTMELVSVTVDVCRAVARVASARTPTEPAPPPTIVRWLAMTVRGAGAPVGFCALKPAPVEVPRLISASSMTMVPASTHAPGPLPVIPRIVTRDSVSSPPVDDDSR